MPLSVLIAFTPSSFIALLVICIVTFAHMAWKTNLMTVTNDIYPTAVVGSVSGIIAFGSGLGGTLFTNLTGQIVQHFLLQLDLYRDGLHASRRLCNLSLPCAAAHRVPASRTVLESRNYATTRIFLNSAPR